MRKKGMDPSYVCERIYMYCTNNVRTNKFAFVEFYSRTISLKQNTDPSKLWGIISLFAAASS
jgi:hypothetical protein